MQKVRKPMVVAEIGCNHRGDLETAKEMIMVAAQFCKVNVVKFQKRNPPECLSSEEYNAPHPNPFYSYGETYGQHRETLEFDLRIHHEFKEICETFRVEYSSSVWDLTSCREIISLKPKLIKVPSPCNTHFEMMNLLCDEFGGQIHVSLGMTTRSEEESIIDFLAKKGRAKDTVIYHCTSGYPVAFEDLNLLEIPRLLRMYGTTVNAIGFSGHHLGIAADVAAFTLGADWVERHFTLDRTWKGTDHAASLEPDGLRRVARNLSQIALSLQEPKDEILPVELVQRKKLKWDRHLRSY
jgi:sialic acid synthase